MAGTNNPESKGRDSIEKMFSSLPDKKDLEFDVELGVLMMNG